MIEDSNNAKTRELITEQSRAIYITVYNIMYIIMDITLMSWFCLHIISLCNYNVERCEGEPNEQEMRFQILHLS